MLITLHPVASKQWICQEKIILKIMMVIKHEMFCHETFTDYLCIRNVLSFTHTTVKQKCVLFGPIALFLPMLLGLHVLYG